MLNFSLSGMFASMCVFSCADVCICRIWTSRVLGWIDLGGIEL